MKHQATLLGFAAASPMAAPAEATKVGDTVTDLRDTAPTCCGHDVQENFRVAGATLPVVVAVDVEVTAPCCC